MTDEEIEAIQQRNEKRRGSLDELQACRDVDALLAEVAARKTPREVAQMIEDDRNANW